MTRSSDLEKLIAARNMLDNAPIPSSGRFVFLDKPTFLELGGSEEAWEQAEEIEWGSFETIAPYPDNLKDRR